MPSASSTSRCSSARRIRATAKFFLPQSTKGEPEAICYYSNDDANPGHLQTRRPPRADGNEGFQCADGKVRNQTDPEGSDNRVEPAGEEERNYRDKRTDGRGNARRQRRTPLVGKAMFG